MSKENKLTRQRLAELFVAACESHDIGKTTKVPPEDMLALIAEVREAREAICSLARPHRMKESLGNPEE